MGSGAEVQGEEGKGREEEGEGWGGCGGGVQGGKAGRGSAREVQRSDGGRHVCRVQGMCQGEGPGGGVQGEEREMEWGCRKAGRGCAKGEGGAGRRSAGDGG